jgi:hypothetical protein
LKDECKNLQKGCVQLSDALEHLEKKVRNVKVDMKEVKKVNKTLSLKAGIKIEEPK